MMGIQNIVLTFTEPVLHLGKTTQRAKADTRETGTYETWWEGTQEMERDRGNQAAFGKPGLAGGFAAVGGMAGMHIDKAELLAPLKYNLYLREVFHFVRHQPQPQHLVFHYGDLTS